MAVDINDRPAEKRERIICYGDSNTYGYDPGLGGSGRYPADVRWTGILQGRSGFEVENHGMCGREIPHYRAQIDFAVSQLEGWRTKDRQVFLWIMLGTNDILMNPGFSAMDVAARMECFLTALTACEAVRLGNIRLRLIAPPRMRPGSWIESGETLRRSEELGEAYGSLARKLGVDFTDAGRWDIPLTFDGVHFSEEGHQRFAAGMMKEVIAHHGYTGG